MKSVRLLPIVILAACALLLFKGIGLITTGEYVLTGVSSAMASGAPAAEPEADHAAAPAAVPAETTMTDSSPTLNDGAPTLGSSAGGGGHGEEDAHAGGDAVPDLGHADPVEGGHAGDPVPDAKCTTDGRVVTTEEIGASIRGATSGTSINVQDCPETKGDAVPVTVDSKGNLVPLRSEDGSPLTEKAVLERLAERRTQLDALTEQLSMRQALVEAAEKKLDERTAALEALEKRINALVDEKKAAEEAEFKALVTMYEGMKPAEAAGIFATLDLGVLIRLARSMSPRKMAPILAKMPSARAQDLTVQLAANQGEPTIDVRGADLAALPQIIGQ